MKKGIVITLIGLFLIIFSAVMYTGYCFVLIGPPEKTQQTLCGTSFLFMSLGVILSIAGAILHFGGRK